jgi:CP family cyanate transporter-like MFS transporter
MSADARSRPSSPRLGSRAQLALLGAGIVLVAFNLRPALASVGPVLGDIRDALGLSGAGASALVTVPVVCFGLLAPVAPPLARRIGLERTVAAALVLLAAGLVVRVAGGPSLLFAGTVCAGGAIAVANVLLPALVKREFPRRVGTMTGIYTTAVTVGATVAAGATVPLFVAFGDSWRAALGIWCVPALVALVAWMPQLRLRLRSDDEAAAVSPGALGALLRNRLAWQVTLFFGLQSLGFYAVLSWLPSIFRDEGFSPQTAGALLAVATLAGTPLGLVVPAFAARARDQRLHVGVANLVAAAGLAGLLIAPGAAPWVWAALIGFGQGTMFPLALTLIALRSGAPRETARLSALVQGAGYLLAAAGPLGVGALHDLAGSWTPAIAVLLALQAPQLAAGLGAGRDRLVSAPPR